MDTIRKDFYLLEGMNRDVNPFAVKPSELQLATNFYSRRFGSKKVRFGYTPFLDAIDNQPVRNLVYFNLPLQKGVFRVSNSKMYKYLFTGSTWGSSVKSLTADKKLGVADLAGTVPYMHFSNDTDGYFTYDYSGGFKSWTVSPSNNKPSSLAAWQSRIFADWNKLSLAQSAISFDLNSGYDTDPFTLNSNDPAGGGTTPINAGNAGQIIDITNSIDRVNIYKQFGAVKYNGSQFLQMPYFGNILAVAKTKNNFDYVLSTNGIFRNTGTAFAPADMGVQTIIEDTLRAHGITNPVAFSFNNLTIFFIGTIRIGSGDNAVDVTNGCLVHHEKYDEWYVWSLGHQMTAFGYYADPSTNEPVMISGDVNGNTYVWGEQYSSDATIPIAYHLRGWYHNLESVDKSKIPDRYTVAIDQGDGANLNIATNYDDSYDNDQETLPDLLNKNYITDLHEFKAISFEVKGSTTTNRPEVHGYTISYKDNEDRRDDAAKGSKRK